MKRLTLPILILSFALSGCSFFNFNSSNATLEKISETTYRYSLEETWNTRYISFRENLMEKPREFCAKTNQGAQLLDSITKEKGSGYEGQIVFRCVNKLPNPKPVLFVRDPD